MDKIDQVLQALSKSKFRSGFYLKEEDLDYIAKKGINVIKSHAADFIRQRLSAGEPINDGKQTPMRGHPVFVAQHATATCCRNCISKWHSIPKGKELSDSQQQYLLQVIMRWIENQTKK